MFVSNDIDATAPQWYKMYRGKSGLGCIGDGFTATAQLDPSLKLVPGARGEYANPAQASAWSGEGAKVERKIDCLGEGFDGAPPCPVYAANRCKRTLSLMFAIPDAPGLGVYQLDTGSVYSILNVNGFLAFLKGITNERIAGIPLMLYAEQQEVTHDKKPTKVTLIRLDAKLTMGQLQEAVGRPYIAAELLPAPAEDPPDDENVIEAESRELHDALPAIDVAAERQRCREILTWAHENWSAEDFANLMGALHGNLQRPDAWTEKGNLKVSQLAPDVAKMAADFLQERKEADIGKGPPPDEGITSASGTGAAEPAAAPG